MSSTTTAARATTTAPIATTTAARATTTAARATTTAPIATTTAARATTTAAIATTTAARATTTAAIATTTAAIAPTTTLQQIGQFIASPTALFSDPITVSKNTATDAWDASFYTPAGILGPWYLSFQADDLFSQSIVGVITNPIINLDRSMFKYGIYLNQGIATAYRLGQSVGTIGRYYESDVFTMLYDGINITYLKNSVAILMYESNDNPDATFYMGGIISTPMGGLTKLFFKQNAYVSNILIQPLSPALTYNSVTYTKAIWSTVMYSPGIYCSGIPTLGKAVLFGLTATPYNPSLQFNQSLITYGFLLNTTVSIIVNGVSTPTVSLPTVAANTDVFRIIHDGRQVKWYKGSTLLYIIRDTTTYTTDPYGICAGLSSGAALNSMKYGQFNKSIDIGNPPSKTPMPISQQTIIFPTLPVIPIPTPYVEGNTYSIIPVLWTA